MTPAATSPSSALMAVGHILDRIIGSHIHSNLGAVTYLDRQGTFPYAFRFGKRFGWSVCAPGPVGEP